ncbi:MAG: cyclic nucleotide-binding domain-containing protein [Bacteroidetes bacterium]|jgi:CRP-like cAMP-binding protein|nr:cyclic nucleotide-binding domain-containing protein [Bacteroidota bacterium]
METTIERVIFLQGIELFRDVPSEQLAHLAGITESVVFEPDEILFRESEPSRSLYLLIEGNVQLTRNGKVRTEIKESEAIGVWGFFDGGDRLMTATCTEESHFLKIDRLDFYDLLEERVHLSEELIKYFVKRIRKLIEASDVVV